MSQPNNVTDYFVELDHPETYVEQLLLESPDAVNQAAQDYWLAPSMLPKNYQRRARSLAHEASIRLGPARDRRETWDASFRGFSFGYLVMANTAVEGPVDLAYGPLVTTQKPKEWRQRIIEDSNRLARVSDVIDQAVNQGAKVINQYENWPKIARHGMLMGLHMAGYGEMRKHQVRVGESAVVAAGYVLDRSQIILARERYRQSMANLEVCDAILDLPLADEPNRKDES